jgi:hypothetical protein
MINCVPFASHLLAMAGSCINIASNWLATAKNNKSPDPCPKRLLVGWQGGGGAAKKKDRPWGWLVGWRQGGGGPSRLVDGLYYGLCPMSPAPVNCAFLKN